MTALASVNSFAGADEQVLPYFDPLTQKDAKCFPTKAIAGKEKWPICAVYLHGWVGGQQGSRSTYETKFWSALEEIATEKKCRIAAPVSDQRYPEGTIKYKKDTSRVAHWEDQTIDYPDQMAVSACKGAKFAKEKTLIGFSNGGNLVIRESHLNCDQVKNLGYTQVVAVGPAATRKPTNGCRDQFDGFFTKNGTHDFPGKAYLQKFIKYKEGGETASAVNVDQGAVRPTRTGN